MTMSIASRTEEMALLGAIAGIGFGLIACVASLVLGAVGVARRERPSWPAYVGFTVSLLPGGMGAWILWKMIEDCYVR
jgi:hypothetical protein